MGREAPDQQQVGSLCDDLARRMEIVQSEEVILTDLIGLTAPVRPYQASQYRRMLDDVRQRYQRLTELIRRFCVPGLADR